jgi:hypothetical protein
MGGAAKLPAEDSQVADGTTGIAPSDASPRAPGNRPHLARAGMQAGLAIDPVSVTRQENVHFYNELLVTPYFVSPGDDKMKAAHNHEFHSSQ